MYREYPKKCGRTPKYHAYTYRGARRWYKSSRFVKANSKKSTARSLLHTLINVEDDYLFEKIEAAMLSAISPYTDVGYYD